MTAQTIEGAEAIEATQSRLFIGGAFVDASAGGTFETINPATEQAITSVQEASAPDVDAAVEAAVEAQIAWRDKAPADRGRILMKLADLIEANGKELASLETLDTGKPIRDTTRVDIPLTAAVFRYFGGFADKIHGETIPVRGPFMSMTLREPIGVIGAITPWNYPVLLASYKIAPALAFGNAVVLKPAEQSPLSALKLAELAREAGVPAGVLNVIPGLGETAGAALASHPKIGKVCFTGSTAVGKKVMKAAADNCTKVQLELGGKSPNVIFEDADLKAAIKGAIFGIFSNKGEICTAGSRLFVHESVKDAVIEGILKNAARMTHGDPFSKDTRMGPQISKAQRDRVLRYVELGKQEGATLITGGGTGDQAKGYFVEPTVFTDVTPDMTIAREEIFGPVLSVMTFTGFDELIEKANQTIYGLAAGVWTQDVKKALRAAKQLQAGTVWVNTYNMYDPTTPFGGFKSSGFGRELGAAAVEEYTQRKSVWIALS
ncbi:MAG: aldehyde dehydrogenase family protein [Planctomycetota bacterium]|jgi:acyl-CoA reductase-like NAD-dependent aldehyde dehydrogenase